MPRRKAPVAPPPPPPSTWRPLARRWALQLAIAFAAVVLALGGLLWLGNLAREQIAGNDRFQIPFSDIDCNPPSGLSRVEFLDEVQYEAKMPERFSVLDDKVAEQLKEGFAKHPWVARVEAVHLAPPRTARVTLAYRQAVLAVIVDATRDWQLRRAVDKDGILMPKKAYIPEDLPTIVSHAPTGSAGEPWGDPAVAAAAKAAYMVGPFWSKLGLTRMGWTQDGVVLSGPYVKIIWGQGAIGEATPNDKCNRLLDAIGGKRPALPWPGLMMELDVRQPGAIERRLVVQGS